MEIKTRNYANTAFTLAYLHRACFGQDSASDLGFVLDIFECKFIWVSFAIIRDPILMLACGDKNVVTLNPIYIGFTTHTDKHTRQR